MWCCVNMEPCPCQESLYRRHLTGRCCVTARQYAVCLGGPFLTLSGSNTFFLSLFKHLPCLIVAEVSEPKFFSPNLISALTSCLCLVHPSGFYFLSFSFFSHCNCLPKVFYCISNYTYVLHCVFRYVLPVLARSEPLFALSKHILMKGCTFLSLQSFVLNCILLTLLLMVTVLRYVILLPFGHVV